MHPNVSLYLFRLSFRIKYKLTLEEENNGSDATLGTLLPGLKTWQRMAAEGTALSSELRL